MRSRSYRHFFFALFVALAGFMSAPQAQAADGCKVLLCLAGNWKNISQCVPDVREAMRDAARGRGWPRCDFTSSDSGGGGTPNTRANMQSAYAPGACPVQYTQRFFVEGSEYWSCSFTYFVDVVVDGRQWSRVWLNNDEDSATEYFEAARAQLPADQIDPRFDNDFAAYEAARLAAERAAAEANAWGVGG